MTVRAALWDFGGVLADSPFEAFARYERQHGLPDGFLRTVNAADADANAWACFERGEIGLDTFATRFEDEALRAGFRVDARAVIGLLDGGIRPAMIQAVRRCRPRLRTALLTNNVAPMDRPIGDEALGDLFDVVIESSKVGVRKPDPRFYQLALEALDIEADEAVFLDDLGINLKPARQLGMTTIKVIDPVVALAELEATVGFSLH
ncbi:MAG: HAD-IA family hydrolase [Acidimicrobiales bacterium]